MQVKVIIGTIAFMLTMMIFGFSALREPARLERFSQAYAGRAVENGADLFQNNCSNCHGVNGRAEECFDPTTGEPTGCIGLPLNNPALLCEDTSQRMEAMSWEGTKADFIRATVAAGRFGTAMPTWSEQFGGPMAEHQVNDVVAFVLNWEDEALCGEAVEAPEWPTQVTDLPEGDLSNGEQLYSVTYGCAGCHGDPATEGSNAVGPWLGDIATEGADRKSEYTAADYVYESILKPNAYIAPDCPGGPCNTPSGMPDNFGQRMSQQDMADIISFLLNTTEFESSSEVIYPESDVDPEFDPSPDLDVDEVPPEGEGEE